MFKNIILSVIALAILVASSAFSYQMLNTQQQEQASANALTQARKDCAEKIYPKAQNVYGEYDKCVAGKGFNDFRN
jgi:hypothetical protein